MRKKSVYLQIHIKNCLLSEKQLGSNLTTRLNTCGTKFTEVHIKKIK